MAVFCSKCGAQLEGNERFCVKCGNDVTAVAAPVAAAPVAPPPAAAPPAPVVAPPQGYAPPPPQGYAPPPPPGYAAPGPIPIMAMPPAAPAKRGGWVWALVIVVVLGGLYYIGKHNEQTQPGTAPTQPGTAPQPGNPGQPGGAPGSAPQPGAPVQPGDPGPGGPNEALVQLQSFGGQWHAIGGYVQISNARWTNRSTVAMQSAVLECDQYASTGAVLAQMRTTLNGPVQAGGSGTYNPFNMGTIAQNLNWVNCGIVAVTPAQ